MRKILVVTAAVLLVSGCAATKPEAAADLNAVLNMAAASEAVYASSHSADPRTVLRLTELLAAAQAALFSWQASSKASDQAMASAAIAALIAYEATASRA